MFSVSNEDGADLQAYVDEALRAFEEDRLDYFLDRERETYGEEVAKRFEQLGERLATQGMPDAEDIASKRPMAMFFLAHQAARLLTAAASEFTYPFLDPGPEPRVAWQTFLEAIGHPSLADDVAEATQLAIAEELCSHLGAKAARCRDLAGRLVAEQPSPRVMQYVRRLSRCYIAGFFPECVILCRAVLESSVRDLYSRRGLALPEDEAGNSTMGDRLRFASERGWLSSPAVRHARHVWQRGNKAVHHEIDATSDIAGTIGLTIAVLVEIYGEG